MYINYIIIHNLQANGCYDLTLIWNTDGVKVANSGGNVLWLFTFTFGEINPIFRFNYLINQIWCDVKKPKMKTYLKSFVNSLKKIYAEGGIKWTCPETNIQYTSQVLAPLVIVDAPVRAQLQNILQ